MATPIINTQLETADGYLEDIDTTLKSIISDLDSTIGESEE